MDIKNKDKDNFFHLLNKIEFTEQELDDIFVVINQKKFKEGY